LFLENLIFIEECFKYLYYKIDIYLCVIFLKYQKQKFTIYVLCTSSCDHAFTDFLSRCDDKFGITKESRSTSIYASFFAYFARTYTLSA